MSLETEVQNLTTQTTALLNAVNTSKATLDNRRDAAAASANAAAVSEANAANSATAAAASATASAAYASMAQATNPDTPIRLNPRVIAADFTVPAAYNGASIGPISILDGVIVIVQNHATWSIH